MEEGARDDGGMDREAQLDALSPVLLFPRAWRQAHLGRTSPTKPMPSRGKEMETSQAQSLVPGTVALKDSDHILGRSCLVKK